MVWALVDPDKEMTERTFRVYGTGDNISVGDAGLPFVGTAFMESLVWHVFDVGEAA